MGTRLFSRPLGMAQHPPGHAPPGPQDEEPIRPRPSPEMQRDPSSLGTPQAEIGQGESACPKRQRRSLPTKPGPEPQPQRGLPLQASSAARWPRGLTARADPAQAASRASKRDPGAGLRCPQDSAPPRSASRRDTGIERGVSHPSRFWEEAEATAGVYLRAVSRLGYRPSDSCAAGLTCAGALPPNPEGPGLTRDRRRSARDVLDSSVGGRQSKWVEGAMRRV